MRNKLLIVIAIVFTGCMTVNTVTDGGPKIPVSRGRTLLNKPIGKWLFYDLEGNIIMEGKYSLAGRETGLWREYYANGTLRREDEYDKGELNGKSIFYSESGVKQIEYEMRNGHWHGKQIEYHANGNKRKEYSVKWPGRVYEMCNSGFRSIDSLTASEPVGTVLVFDENEQLIEKGCYLRGAIWSSINPKGEEVQCLDSVVKSVGQRTRFIKTGTWEYYTKDSVIKKTYFLGEELYPEKYLPLKSRPYLKE